VTSPKVSAPNSRPVAVSPWPMRRAGLGSAGWAAVLAPGVVTGAGIAIVTAGGRPGLGRLAGCVAGGMLTGTLIARIVDEVRWRRSAVSLEVDEPDAALDLMQAVRAEGVRADMVRAEHRAGPAGGAYALRYRAKDDRRVRAVFAEQRG